MQDVFFKRDLEHDTWVESHDTELVDSSFSQAPIVIVATHYCERTGEEWCKAWCDKHQAYEDIDKYEASGLTTVEGCKLIGLLAPVRISSYQSDYSYDSPHDSPYVCYQISPCPKTGAVHITSSKVTINFVWLKNEKEDFIAIPKGFSRESFTHTLRLDDPEQPTYAPNFPAPIILSAHNSALSPEGNTDNSSCKCAMELWLVGYAELKNNGIFLPYKEAFFNCYKKDSEMCEAWQYVKVYQQFSMNRFSIDLNDFIKNEKLNENKSEKMIAQTKQENLSKIPSAKNFHTDLKNALEILGERHKKEIFN